MKIDKADRAILVSLQADSRTTLADLASVAHLSVSQVQRRVKRLEQDGVIAEYTARLDAVKLGYEVAAFVEVTLAAQDTRSAEAFHKAVRRIPEITECHRVSGDADYLIRVVAKDLKGYSRLAQEKILGIAQVDRIRSHIVFESPKDTMALPVTA